MALAQVERVQGMLAAARPDVTVEVVSMTTSGDRWQGSLADLGGKGAFTKEVDQALLDGRVDLAVHCVKDVPGDRPAPTGTALAAYLARDDIRDCLVHPAGARIEDLPAGTRIGTSSVRRTAQLALHWPHLVAVPIRGNANSRLAKLDAGDVDALLLAVAGLHRIGAAHRITHTLNVDTMVPAVGAGTLVLQCRDDDTVTRDLAASLGDRHAWAETVAERTMLRQLPLTDRRLRPHRTRRAAQPPCPGHQPRREGGAGRPRVGDGPDHPGNQRRCRVAAPRRP
jgi:hydroxymethylbilane synthase